MSQLASLSACQIPLRSGLPPAVRGARYARVWPARDRTASASTIVICILILELLACLLRGGTSTVLGDPQTFPLTRPLPRWLPVPPALPDPWDARRRSW